MSLAADLKILYHLALRPVHGQSHAERMENFYRGQAEAYDRFRERLLPGRRELWESLPAPAGGVWCDLGGGTGANAVYLGDRLAQLKGFYLVDLSESLLAQARQRAKSLGWTNVVAVQADATQFQPAEPVDVVTCCYSLTMIPDWFAAIDHAWNLLKPGGYLGVVDFYVSRKYPAPGRARHGSLTRALWPLWFAADNVHLSADHLPYLQRRFAGQATVSIVEGTSRLPYLPGVRVPYYRFLGRKPA